MTIDVPVKSWGIYMGLIGDKVKHIVITKNSFRYADGLFDLDYTAIPFGWVLGVCVLVNKHIPNEAASKLVNSFMLGGHRAFNRPRTFRRNIVQQRLSVNGRPIKLTLTRRRIASGRNVLIEESNEMLVLGVKFAIGMTAFWSALELAHMEFMHSRNAELFATITGLSGTVIGLFVGQKS